MTGNLGTCAGLTDVASGDSGLARKYPFGCTGRTAVAIPVDAGTTNLNINGNSQCLVTREIQRTDTYRSSDIWRLIGVPQTVSVTEPGTLPLLGLGLGLASVWVGAARRRNRQLALRSASPAQAGRMQDSDRPSLTLATSAG